MYSSYSRRIRWKDPKLAALRRVRSLITMELRNRNGKQATLHTCTTSLTYKQKLLFSSISLLYWDKVDTTSRVSDLFTQFEYLISSFNKAVWCGVVWILNFSSAIYSRQVWERFRAFGFPSSLQRRQMNGNWLVMTCLTKTLLMGWAWFYIYLYK